MRHILSLFYIVSLCGCFTTEEASKQSNTKVNSSGNHLELSLNNILDLNKDGWNVFELSATAREFFISHPDDGTKLYQWNLSKKKIIHTYGCPKGHIRWDEAKVSPDGKLLIASTYPDELSTGALVYFIDTASHKILQTFQYQYLIREIKFNKTGNLIWIETTWPGPDKFVRDKRGEKIIKFNKDDFLNPNISRLWDVPNSKGGPPPGLFYKDSNEVTHKLIPNPLNQYYSFTTDSKYIGASTWDQRVIIWRVKDLKEVFNQKIGAHAVSLKYDPIDNQFLILTGIDKNTHLRAIKIKKGEQKSGTD